MRWPSSADRARCACPRRAPAPETLRLTVADNGPGVAADMMDTLFEPLATSKSHGLGLGLAISRTIVEAHGGRLSLEPATTGAAFCLTLPVAH